MPRIFLAGFLAAVAMFVWTAVAHMGLPLGAAGFSQIPNEAVPAAALNTAIGDKAGLYLFPWTDPKNHDAMADYAAKAKVMPSGFLVYHPPGKGTEMTGATLGGEFAKQLVCCMIAAVLLARAGGFRSFALRVGFVTAIGAIAALTDNVSNSLWYGFPTAYMTAQIIIDWVAYIVAGLVLAAIIKPPAAA